MYSVAENELPVESTTTKSQNASSATSNKSKRKNAKPQQRPQPTVDQLTTRLDDWCSISYPLKRRNNIYGNEQQRSTNYNPHQEYDYSNQALSQQIRKLQCQNANKEVRRGLTGSDFQAQHDPIINEVDMEETKKRNSPSTERHTSEKKRRYRF